MHQRTAMLLSAMALTVGCAQTDAGISSSVKSKLAADDTVKAYQIDVDTADKVVTLTGAVETPAARQQAVMIARGTDGVREVVDRLTVDPRAAATTGDLREGAEEAERDAREKADAVTDRSEAVLTDPAITSAVKAKLLADTTVSGLRIDVDTRAGVVTLNGTANTGAEARQAVTLAENTDGVKRVVNNLKVGR